MVCRRKQSLGCGVSWICVFLMLYAYCALYSSQWNIPVMQIIINAKNISLIKTFFESNATFLGSLRSLRNKSHRLTEHSSIPEDSTRYPARTTTHPPSNFTTTESWNFTTEIPGRKSLGKRLLHLMTEEEYESAKRMNRDRLLSLRRSCERFDVMSNNKFLNLVTRSRGNIYKIPGKVYLPQSPYASSFQVDLPDEILFCWQYKVGSTAWNAMFAHLLNQTKVIEKRTFYHMREIMAVKDIRQMQKALKFYRFMIVRHPFERLLSAYRDRIEDTSHKSWQREHFGPKILAITRHQLKRWQIMNNGNLTVIPTFSEFVRYLLATPLVKYDPHWAPFWKHCVPCEISYHAVGRSETQAQDMRFILEDSGLAQKVDIKILEENAHQGRGDTKELMLKYYSTLDLQTLEWLYRKYEVDFFLFEYEVQPLLDELYPGQNISFPSSFR